jgi:hypothetical protein
MMKAKLFGMKKLAMERIDVCSQSHVHDRLVAPVAVDSIADDGMFEPL